MQGGSEPQRRLVSGRRLGRTLANGHFGGLQFSPDTWKAGFGGLEFADRPDHATPLQQKIVANRTAFTGWKGQKPQGLGAWETITNGKVPGVTTSSVPQGQGLQHYQRPAAPTKRRRPGTWFAKPPTAKPAVPTPTTPSAAVPGVPSVGGDFGAAAGHPTVAQPDENTIRSQIQQMFGIPNTFGTGSWENAAHDADGAWHHNLTHDKSVPGYAFDFHGTPEQMAALAAWIKNNAVPTNTGTHLRRTGRCRRHIQHQAVGPR
jgi:hypothetical protein